MGIAGNVDVRSVKIYLVTSFLIVLYFHNEVSSKILVREYLMVCILTYGRNSNMKK